MIPVKIVHVGPEDAYCNAGLEGMIGEIEEYAGGYVSTVFYPVTKVPEFYIFYQVKFVRIKSSLYQGGKKMTKKQLLQLLEDFTDDAVIFRDDLETGPVEVIVLTTISSEEAEECDITLPPDHVLLA